MILIWLLNAFAMSRLKKEREEFDKETHELAREYDSLMCQLFEYLLPLKADMDRLKANVEGRHVVGRHAVVKIDDWPEQYAFGIDRCCGFILDWK
jgi:hypothetical protein